MNRSSSVLALVLSLAATTTAFVAPAFTTSSLTAINTPPFFLQAKPDDDEDDNKTPFNWDDALAKMDEDSNDQKAKKLGIDIGSMLGPLSSEDAADIKKDARKMIDARVDAGLKDIERMRAKMDRETEKSKRAMDFASELEAQRMQQELNDKINAMSENFLASTSTMRESTKQAATASRAMEGGRGLELGTWGTLNGRTVIADSSLVGDGAPVTLLGSVDNRVREISLSTSDLGLEESVSTVQENRILILADVKQDPLAKQLVPLLEQNFATKSKIPNLTVQILAPTATMPLGGNDAACVIVFCSSLSQPSSLKQILDKLLRKTIGASGTIGKPPTQLVGITTVGTERTNKFPYSVQNMMGGKLDTRRQVEEVLINAVRNRPVEPPLDFTLIKFGEVKEGDAKPFELRPGDVLDGTVSAGTAEQVIIQSVAFQPTARNSTFCVAGSLPADILESSPSEEASQVFWADAFVPLEGPELWRLDLADYSVELYGQLSEYIQEWAGLLAASGKGLTTPIQVIDSLSASEQSRSTVQAQNGLQMVYLPTATGKNYASRDEERQKEGMGARGSGAQGKAPMKRRLAKEGGITVLVEKTRDNALRVRARRCNYANGAVIKEITEETILKRLQDAMDVWKKDHNA